MMDFSNTNKMVSMNTWQIKKSIMDQQLSKINSLKDEKIVALQTKAVCLDFESIFLNHLLKEMRANVPKSGFLDGGQAEQIYTAMYDEHIARKMANSGGIGLARIIEKSLLHHQNENADLQTLKMKKNKEFFAFTDK